MVDKEKKEAPRFVDPMEAEMAAHHLKKAHEVKQDKDLHKAAKRHLKHEHEKLADVLGKKVEDKNDPDMKKPKKSPKPKSEAEAKEKAKGKDKAKK